MKLKNKKEQNNMKKIVLILGILGLVTSCTTLEDFKTALEEQKHAPRTRIYNPHTGKYEKNDIHTQIDNAYGVKKSKGQPKWDINYEDIMY